mmetsp:Transcript_18991/g.20947  ORF Transcript_18991/g.20947 Transcript_18991/m.20947 type:complete len:81 (+) Transcript_18991:561-803(+)
MYIFLFRNTVDDVCCERHGVNGSNSNSNSDEVELEFDRAVDRVHNKMVSEVKVRVVVVVATAVGAGRHVLCRHPSRHSFR